MRILHITDLHYSATATAWDFKILFEALIENITAEHNEKPIDLVFITGDLVDKGGSSLYPKNAYEVLKENILDRLCTLLNLTHDRIVIIPGNHDVSEKKGFNQFFLKGLRSSKIDIVSINQLVENNLHTIVEKEINGLENFKAFETSFYASEVDTATEIRQSKFESCFTFQFGQAKVGVAAFNSSWNCLTSLDSDDNYKLAFGTSQILRASELFRAQKTDFNIALLHHPIRQGFFTEEEENEMMTAFSKGNFSLLFFGHTHRAKDEYTVDADSGYYLVVTKSCFNPREKAEPYKSGFSIVDLSYSSDTEIGVCRHFRKYVQNKRFDFDVEEASQGKSVKKIQPISIGKNFLRYLQSESNISFDPNRKVLSEQINSLSHAYIKSPFPEIADRALKSIIEKFLIQTSGFTSYVKGQKTTWEIKPVDEHYYSLEQTQSYTIITTKDKYPHIYRPYIDRLLNGLDKSDLNFVEYKIDGKDMMGHIATRDEILPEADVYGTQRITKSIDIELEGKESYEVYSKFVAIHPLQTKLSWVNINRRIAEGFEINIIDSSLNYHCELFGITKGTYYSNRTNAGKKLSEISIKQPNEILIPSDQFWLFVSSD